MDSTTYDDEVVLKEYLLYYSKYYTTDLEKRSLRISQWFYRVEVSKSSEEEMHREWAMRADQQLAEMVIEEDVMPVLKIGYKAYWEMIQRRLYQQAFGLPHASWAREREGILPREENEACL